MDLTHILLMFRCAECGNLQDSIVTDLDKAIDVLTKLRAMRVYAAPGPLPERGCPPVPVPEP